MHSSAAFMVLPDGPSRLRFLLPFLVKTLSSGGFFDSLEINCSNANNLAQADLE
jgi:hypothetical protein